MRGQMQSAYRVLVTGSEVKLAAGNGDRWDSVGQFICTKEKDEKIIGHSNGSRCPGGGTCSNNVRG